MNHLCSGGVLVADVFRDQPFHMPLVHDDHEGRFNECLGRTNASRIRSPKTRRSSPKAKKGINTTNNTTVSDNSPFHDPPAKAAMLSPNDLPRYLPTIAASTILKHASRTVYTSDFSSVG